MIESTLSSRQYRVFQILVLTKSLVERDHLEVGGFGKGCQVGITPDVGRKTLTLRKVAPCYFHTVWLSDEHNAFVGQHYVETSPRSNHRDGMSPKYFWIRRQTQESHLGNTANAAAILVSNCLHPSVCRCVMKVRREGERQPKIDIRKVHSNCALPIQCLHHPIFRRFARWLGRSFPVRPSKRLETQLSFVPVRLDSLSCRKPPPTPSSLPEKELGQRIQLHRFVQHLEFPYSHYGNYSPKNQVCGLGWVSRSGSPASVKARLRKRPSVKISSCLVTSSRAPFTRNCSLRYSKTQAMNLAVEVSPKTINPDQ